MQLNFKSVYGRRVSHSAVPVWRRGARTVSQSLDLGLLAQRVRQVLSSPWHQVPAMGQRTRSGKSWRGQQHASQAGGNLIGIDGVVCGLGGHKGERRERKSK